MSDMVKENIMTFIILIFRFLILFLIALFCIVKSMKIVIRKFKPENHEKKELNSIFECAVYFVTGTLHLVPALAIGYFLLLYVFRHSLFIGI